MTEAREPVQLAAEVIREAITCDRPQCTPDDHHRFVIENMQIAHRLITKQQ
ncbi:hypothetical protein ACGFYU_15050 [Streptomyces sp. NPDC048337]|uniref:hypothetical protein n=1 Tax=Streptomyces sp. NPDC048337 TaxID=3365535 RepID=UPI0037200C0E